MDYPLPGFGGLQILEYGTWTWFGSPGSTPRGLRRELTRAVGPYPGPEHLHVLSVPDPAPFRDRLVEGARTKGRAARWLLTTKPWDMVFVSFGEPHGAGHYLWHTGDPLHPAARDYALRARRMRCATSTWRSTPPSATSWRQRTTGPRDDLLG